MVIVVNRDAELLRDHDTCVRSHDVASRPRPSGPRERDVIVTRRLGGRGVGCGEGEGALDEGTPGNTTIIDFPMTQPAENL